MGTVSLDNRSADRHRISMSDSLQDTKGAEAPAPKNQRTDATRQSNTDHRFSIPSKLNCPPTMPETAHSGGYFRVASPHASCKDAAEKNQRTGTSETKKLLIGLLDWNTVWPVDPPVFDD